MESQRSQSAQKAPCFTWNDDFVKMFADVLIAYRVKYGKKQPFKWNDIATEFVTKCGKPCNKETVRNKFEAMKREYKAWSSLINSEISLESDPTTRRIIASDEWWDTKIKEDVNCKKFRSKGMDADYEDLLMRLFAGTVATGRLAFSPSMNPSPLTVLEPLPIALDEQSGGKERGGDGFFGNFTGAVDSKADVFISEQWPSKSQPYVETPQDTPQPPVNSYSPQVKHRSQSCGSSKFEEQLAHTRSDNDKMLSLFHGEITSKSADLNQQDKDVQKGPKFFWDDGSVKIFVDLLIAHRVKYGKKQPFKWRDIATEFVTKCGKPCHKETLRNKYEAMKREHKAWTLLKHSETAIGSDPITGRIVASDEWWDRKIKENAYCKKFRGKAMDADYEELLARLFTGTVATERLAFCPSMDPAQLTVPEPMPIALDEQSGGEELGGNGFFHNSLGTINSNPDVFPSEQQPSNSQPYVETPEDIPQPLVHSNPPQLKRKRSQSCGSSKFEEHLAPTRSNNGKIPPLLRGEITSKSTDLNQQAKDVLDILDGMTASGDLEEGSPLWCFAVTLNADKNYRALFVSMRTSHQRLSWLKFMYENRDGK